MKKIIIPLIFTLFFAASYWIVHVIINGSQIFSLKIIGLTEEKNDYEILRETGEKTAATITDITTPRRSTIRDKIYHYMTAEFTLDKKYSGYYTVKDDELKSLHGGEPVGQSLVIIYSPDNPRINAPEFNFNGQYKNINENISAFTTLKKIFLNLLTFSACSLALVIIWIIIRKSLLTGFLHKK